MSGSARATSAFRRSRAIRRIGVVLNASVEVCLDNGFDVLDEKLDGVVGIGDVAGFRWAECFYVRLEIGVVAFGEEGAGRVLAKTWRCFKVDEVVSPFQGTGDEAKTVIVEGAFVAKAGDHLLVGVVPLDNAVTKTKWKGCWDAVEVGVMLVEVGW